MSIICVYSAARLRTVDEDQLDTLEKELDEAEKQLQDSDLDKYFSELQEANMRVMDLKNEYTLAIDDLREQVNNIEDIKNALPDGCYKNKRIEYEET